MVGEEDKAVTDFSIENHGGIILIQPFTDG